VAPGGGTAEPAGGTPQEMAAILVQDHACYGELAAQLGLRIGW
jgi:hypothetical protein